MKKIFTLFMATVVALSTFAVLPAQVGPKSDANKNERELQLKQYEHRKQVAKMLGVEEFGRKPIQKAPVKKAAQGEEYTLNYDAFAGLMCVDEELGTWWLGLECNDWDSEFYGYNLQLQWTATPDNPCGTFTTEDFDYDFTHLLTPYSFGSIMFSEVTMTLSYEKVSENLERYLLEATLVSEDGDTYHVHAKHEKILPKEDLHIYLDNGTMTKTLGDVTFEAKNDSVDIKLVVMTSSVEGNYGSSMIDWENTKIEYKGVALTPMTFKAELSLAVSTTDESMAYMADINMLATDTVQYQFLIAAPLPEPTETIEITCSNLEVESSYGMVDFTASNSDYAVQGNWYADMAEAGTYEAAIFLNEREIVSLKASVVLSLDADNNWVIEGSMLGDDNVVYNLHLSKNIPVPTDTVLVSFETSAKAEYYPFLEPDVNDLTLKNENDLYSASINVHNVEMGGEFTQEDMVMYASQLMVYDAESLNVAEVRNGKLYQVGDTTKLEADYYTYEAVLYQVRLWYVAPTPTETVTLDFPSAECNVDFEYSGAFNLIAYTPDNLTFVSLTGYATSVDEMVGTFENDGMFGKFGEGKYQIDASRSYVGKQVLVEDPDMGYSWYEITDMYPVEKGQFTVVMDEENNITLTGSVVCSDAVQYNVTMASKYVKPHIEFDSESDPVERIYDENAEITITDKSEDSGIISVKIEDTVEGDITVLWFNVNEADAETVLPEGTYSINNSWIVGSVAASTGMDWDGSVYPSYYAGYTDGLVAEPYYFFVSGEVVVTKRGAEALRIEVNALNSCDVPVHIVYDPAGNGIENINVNVEGVKKQIIDDQLYIINGGKAFNVLGARVK